MRTSSNTYKSIRGSGFYRYEIRVVKGQTIYGMDDLFRIKLSSGLYKNDQPGVGGTVAAEVDLDVLETAENWGYNADFEIQFRIVSADGESVSEWITYGTYFTDIRKQSANGILSIVAYDAMLKCEQTWWENVPSGSIPLTFPMTAKTAAELIHLYSAINIESYANFDNTNAYIGLNTKATIRETLESIAVGMGGNWYAVSADTVRLVPFKVSIEDLPAIVGQAIVGTAIVGSGGDASLIEIGTNVVSYDKGIALPGISAVTVTADDGTVASAEDSGQTGFQLNTNCNYASSSIATALLDQVRGYSYQPFNAHGAWLDPVAELGDIVSVDGTFMVVGSLDVDFGSDIYCEIKAPYDEEVNHEYLMVGGNQKMLRKTLQQLSNSVNELRAEYDSTIAQTATEIRLEVSENYYTNNAVDVMVSGLQTEISDTATDIVNQTAENYYNKTQSDEIISGINTTITQTSSGLETSINRVSQDANGGFNEIKSYIRYELTQESPRQGVVIIGDTESESDFRVSNTEIGAYINGQRTTYWNQNEQYTPNKLHIPNGGSLQEGSFIWQPRSSGNLSLMWIGS